MFYKVALLAVAFLFTISAVNAQSNPLSVRKESRRYGQWHDKDVVYIITDEEKKVYLSLTTEEERRKFQEDFWLRRDPDPDTEINEFREEYYERTAYSNTNFSTKEKPGWKTERGRIYITFGKPDSIVSIFDDGKKKGASEIWHYKSFIGVCCESVDIKFYDLKQDGDYIIDGEENRKLFMKEPSGLIKCLCPKEKSN